MSDTSLFDVGRIEYDKTRIAQNEIFLNYDSHYVQKNIMIDNEEIGLNVRSSFAINVLGCNDNTCMQDESHYFLPKELVYHYVSKLMKKHKAFEYAIE